MGRPYRSDRVRVLVVDDSPFARMAIARKLSLDPEIEVVGFAEDGEEALAQVRALRPDVVTMDVMMPRLDGLSALARLMAEHPLPVVMVSNLTTREAEVTLRALELGAVDFYLKPLLFQAPEARGSGPDLPARLKAVARVGVERLRHQAPRPCPKSPPPPPPALRRVVVIGSSTGGPRALFELLPALPGDLPAAVVVVQHMPAGFTGSLAERLNEACRLRVREGAQGDLLKPGEVLVAPGGYHLDLSVKGTVRLTQDPPVWGVRPSADITMRAAARAYGRAVIGVVLTGMGCDGTRGAASIKEAGGTVLAQDASTSVVYGMPRSVVEAGLADRVLPLDRIAPEIVHLCQEG